VLEFKFKEINLSTICKFVVAIYVAVPLIYTFELEFPIVIELPSIFKILFNEFICDVIIEF
jgi:hypothetical protein